MTFGDSPDHVLSASIGDTLHVLIKQVVDHEVPICIMGGGVVCDAAGWNSQASQYCRVQMEKKQYKHNMLTCWYEHLLIVYVRSYYMHKANSI